MSKSAEARAVAGRYARRDTADGRYSIRRPEVWLALQERQRAMLRLFNRERLPDLSTLRLLEVGCGAGGNLLEMLRVGFRPEHLTGIELLPERCAQARAVLPAPLTLHAGDALQVDLRPQSQDIVLAASVFSSLLDEAFQARLAQAMWHWLKPGGAVLWYDFTFDNPRNPDVRGVPRARLEALFPHGRVQAQRVTLAPPLARRVCRVHPALYGLFNSVPWLRTHLLAWVAKPAAAPA